jgi:hypothetical protein
MLGSFAAEGGVLAVAPSWNLPSENPDRIVRMRPFLELPKQAGLPSWLDGRHPLYLTEDNRLVDDEGEILNKATFIQTREELGARILTNSRGKVAQALGFSGGGAAGIIIAVKVSRYSKNCGYPLSALTDDLDWRSPPLASPPPPPFLRTQDRVPVHVLPVFPWLEVLACLAPCPT